MRTARILILEDAAYVTDTLHFGLYCDRFFRGE